MVQYAKQKSASGRVEITTNGVLLSAELGRSLINAGLSKLFISIQATSSEGYKKVTGKHIDLKKLVRDIEHFYQNKGDCQVYIKIADTSLEDERDEEKFFKIFGDFCDEIAVEQIDKFFENAIDAKPKTTGCYGQPIVEKAVCTFLFTRLVICSDGSAVACCMDWSRRNIIGNTSTERLYDIWHGKELRDLQLTHLQRNRHLIPICKDCYAPGSICIDNIDEYADALYMKLQGQELR